jgi:hypothetical protein
MTRPLQVFVDHGEIARLEAWAAKRGWTKSQAIRVAIRALVQSDAEEQDPLLGMSGMIVEGLPADASESFDRHLLATFVAERSTPYRRKARSSPARRRPR